VVTRDPDRTPTHPPARPATPWRSHTSPPTPAQPTAQPAPQTTAQPAPQTSRELVVDLVRSSGPISRVELAQASGLTQASISTIVRRLLDEGLVRETGRVASTGGKPRTMVEINPRAVYGMGVQIGEDALTYVVTDMRGGVVGRLQVDAGPAASDDVTAAAVRIVDGFHDVVGSLGLASGAVAGLAVVGPRATLAHGVRTGPRSTESALHAGLHAALALRLGLPVIVDNDAAAAALGEFWSRQVPRSETFACVYLGTGVGSGIVLDGALHRGASSGAGELGHVSIDLDGEPCYCGNRGCLELAASPGAVVARARRDAAAFDDLGLAWAPGGVARDFDLLARAAIAGHAAADGLVTRAAEQLAAGVVTLANLLDLDRVVLSGPGVAVAGSIYARAAVEALARTAFSRGVHTTRVEVSTDPRDAAAIGAAALVVQRAISR